MAFALKGAGSATTAWSVSPNQSSLVVTTVTTAGAAGDVAVLLYAVDNNQTTDGDEGAVTSVTDSAGNFWSKCAEFTNGQGTAQTGAVCGVWWSNLQFALPTSSTVTLNFSNSASRDASAASLTYFTVAAGYQAVLEGSNTLANDAAAAGSLDVTTTNTVPCLRIRATASESSVATAWTKTAAFTAVLTQAISTGGGAATNQGIRGEYLISTATGQASAPTGGAGAVDNASVYIAFRENWVAFPKNNSDEIAPQVLINRRKTAAAILLSASAGLFLPPYPTVQVIPPVLLQGWQQPLSTAPEVVKAAYTTPDLISPPVVAATGVPVAVSSGAPRARRVYYQSKFDPPAFIQAAPVEIGVALDMGGAAPRARKVYYQSKFDPPTFVAATAPVGIPINMGDAAPSYRTTYYQSKFETPYVAPVVSVYTDFDWYQPLSSAPPVAKAKLSDWQLPYNVTVVTAFGWQQALSTAPSVVKAQQGTSFVPFNTTQLAVNYTDFDWYSPLSVAAPVVKAQPGYAFVPYNTAQLAVNYTDFDWYQPLSTAPTVAKAKFGDWQFPYTVTSVVTVDKWQSPLSISARVAKAQPDFGFVPYNTAQLAVNYTDFDWYSPLSPAPPVVRVESDFGAFSYSPVQVAVNYTNFGWYQPLSVASPVAKAQQGPSFVPYNTAQVVVTYTNFYQQSLSVAVPVARAAQDFGSVPYSIPQADTLEWQQPLSTAPAIAKVKTGDWQFPYSVASVVTADEWQQPLWTAPAVARAQQGFSFVPFDTAQLSVNYTSYGWYQPLSVPARVTPKAAQEGSSSVPYNTPQRFAYSNYGWYGALSTVPRVTPKGQVGIAIVPFNTPQRFNYTNLGWYMPLSAPAKITQAQMGISFTPWDTVQVTPAASEDHIVKFIGNVGHFMLR